MQNVFWFTGSSCSGKTTLTNKLKKILGKDFSIQIIDEDQNITKLGGYTFRAKQHDAFIKKVVSLVKAFSKQNELVLVAVVSPKQKHRNYARKMLGNIYYEIYLQCSDRCLTDRMKKRSLPDGMKNLSLIDRMEIRRVIIFRKTFRLVSGLYRFLTFSRIYPISFETPLSPDHIINTEKETIDESINNIINFFHSKNRIHQPSK